MRNSEIADFFHEIADILEIKQEDVFRIRAYRRAAEQLESMEEDALAALDAGRKIPGIGAELSAKIREVSQSGTMAYLDQLRQDVPASVLEMMALPGIGPKSARLLHESLGIGSIEALEEACRSGRILEARGFQEKTRQKILKGIERRKVYRASVSLSRGLEIASKIAASLRANAPVQEVEIVGALRRRCDTMDRIELLAVTRDAPKVLDRVVSLPQVRGVEFRDETTAAFRNRDDLQILVHTADPAAVGSALTCYTGSEAHRARLNEISEAAGATLSPRGLFRGKGRGKGEGKGGGRDQCLAGETETGVYAALGLPWIPPELRENEGEFEAAGNGGLPRLVEVGDLKGDLHAHTDWSDGHHSLAALVDAAQARGYDYIVVSDHSRSTTIARGLTPERVREQAGAIRALQANRKIRILTGTECDILEDGTLDFPDEVLAELDVVLAAVHSRFQQPKAEMTARICRALGNRHVRVLVHPTGRLIGTREPYDVDLDEVFRIAKANGKAVEINSSPHRLDLKDRHARLARDMGVKISIDTDTHYLSELANVELGVAMARRAWIGPESVVNAMPLEAFQAWARAGR